MGKSYDYKHVPTIAKFAASNAFFRALVGPFGSGKSSGCVLEILQRAKEQKKGPDGIRHTRFAVIRSTYPQLSDTTMKTFFDWFPPSECGQFKETTHTYNITFMEGVLIEVWFRALDRPDHISNLLSAEYTAAWVNEAREVPWSIIEAMTGRVRRYPAEKDGGCTWGGIFMDTNPPDDDSKFYRFFEETEFDKKLMTDLGFTDSKQFCQVFKQSSGLSPQAENLSNLPKNYYPLLCLGKDEDWIQVYVHGEYGMTREGKPVHPSYRDSIHCSLADIETEPGLDLILGTDFGLTPAIAISQIDVEGHWRVIDELYVKEHGGMGISQFAKDVVRPHLLKNYPEHMATGRIQSYCDPAGKQQVQTNAAKIIGALNNVFKNEFVTIPAYTNDLAVRKDALDRYLTIPDGFLLSPKCKQLRKALRGKYCFQRLAVSGQDRYRDKPTKNIHSHIAESLQYACLMAQESDLLVDPLDLRKCFK